MVQDLSYSFIKAQSLLRFAQADLQLGNGVRARNWLTEAQRLTPSIGKVDLQAITLTEIALVSLSLDRNQAEPLLAQSLTLTQKAIQQYPIFANNALTSIVLENGNQLRVSIATAYAQIGQRDRAFNIINQITDPITQAKALITLAIVHQRHNEPQKAEQRFSQAIARFPKSINAPGHWEFAIHLVEASIPYAQAGQIQAIERVMPQLKTYPQLQAKVWLIMAGEARKQNQPALAKQAFDRFTHKLKSTGVGLLDGYDWQEFLLDTAKRQGYEPEIKAALEQLDWHHLVWTGYPIEWTLKTGNVEKAFTMLNGYARDVPFESAQAMFIEQLAVAYAKNNQPDRAIAVLDQYSPYGTPSKIIGLARVLGALEQSGDRTRAEAILQDITRRIQQTNGNATQALYLLSVVSTLEFNPPPTTQNTEALFQQAVSLLATMNDSQENPQEVERALQTIANTAYQTNRIETVLQLQAKLTPPNAQILNNALLRWHITPATANNFEQVLNRALDPTQKALRGTELAQVLIAQQQQQRALTVLEQTTNAISSLPDRDRSPVLETVALLYAQLGQPRRAAAIAEQIGTPTERKRVQQILGCF
jgi:hypothetical protein